MDKKKICFLIWFDLFHFIYLFICFFFPSHPLNSCTFRFSANFYSLILSLFFLSSRFCGLYKLYGYFLISISKLNSSEANLLLASLSSSKFSLIFYLSFLMYSKRSFITLNKFSIMIIKTNSNRNNLYIWNKIKPHKKKKILIKCKIKGWFQIYIYKLLLSFLLFFSIYIYIYISIFFFSFI